MLQSERQRLFSQLVGKFITWCYEPDPVYELTFGEVKRTQAQATQNAAAGTGISNSLHLQSLAVDFNLFIGGVFQTSKEAYQPLGDYWKSLHPDCCWGGDFKSPDSDHFSLTPDNGKTR